MTQFKGFATLAEAEAFCEEIENGFICYREYVPVLNLPTSRGFYYDIAVRRGWIDPFKFPYCVLWKTNCNES